MRASLQEHPRRAAGGRRGDEGCGEGALSAARPEGFQKLLAGFAKVAWRCEAGGYNVPGWVDGGRDED